MTLIPLSLPVTEIKLFNRETNTVTERLEMGKLNQKTCNEIAKAENSVLISKVNTVKEYTVNTEHLPQYHNPPVEYFVSLSRTH